MSLPEKPADVAHVSDAHWEAALDEACSRQGYIFQLSFNWSSNYGKGVIDHARCLMLLGEVAEPVDPIGEAIKAARSAWVSDPRYFENHEAGFEAACRKHLAGLTFPEVKP